MLDRQQTVAAVVLDHPECAAVFQKHRIDFCCKGGLSLEVAAQGRKLEVEQLLGELTEVISRRTGPPAGDPRTLSNQQLVAQLVAGQAQVTESLPFVEGLARKVARVHGEHNPKLVALSAAVGELFGALPAHLEAEQETLFPALVAEEVDRARVAGQLEMMSAEHEGLSVLLARVRAASDDFTLPEWACRSYRTLFAELQHLEALLHQEVHLENHVLRPRFA